MAPKKPPKTVRPQVGPANFHIKIRHKSLTPNTVRPLGRTCKYAPKIKKYSKRNFYFSIHRLKSVAIENFVSKLDNELPPALAGR